MFLIFLGNIFASWEANFVSATMFPEVGKQGNIDRKHNVSATIFPNLPTALNSGLDPNPVFNNLRISLFHCYSGRLDCMHTKKE